MSSELTKLRNSLVTEAKSRTRGRHGDRFVDFGIRVEVVRGDSAGHQAIPGKPPLSSLRTEHLGGIWDCALRRFVGPSANPIVWYVSERQAGIVLDDDSEQTRVLLYSAEGGGKTVTLGMWGIVQVVKLAAAGIFVAGGATAPTHERLQTLVKAYCERIPTDTAKYRVPGSLATYISSERELRFVTGHVVQFRSTKKASSATGSPIQGFTWGWESGDEIQDSVENGADPDIEARLRGAKTSRRLDSATAKDSPRWRAFRDEKLGTPDWKIERIRYDENPFVWADHWERMQRNVSPREWQRRGLALDVGPERMLYTSWSRDANLRPVPRIGKKDVTRLVTSGFDALVGHDPGKLHDVSLLLKCYEVERVRNWWVVDEITTDNTTTEQHIAELTRRLRGTWQLQLPEPDEPKVMVRCDPYGDSDNKTDRSVYTSFKLAGYRCLSAAYNKQGLGTGRIDREARIEMVQRLLCNAAGERRLFIDCDDRRQPCAVKLVEAIELSEREEGTGKAERGKKGANDLTHWPAALGYALWPYERVRDVLGPPREALA